MRPRKPTTMDAARATRDFFSATLSHPRSIARSSGRAAAVLVSRRTRIRSLPQEAGGGRPGVTPGTTIDSPSSTFRGAGPWGLSQGATREPVARDLIAIARKKQGEEQHGRGGDAAGEDVRRGA